jgi:hypothetical protein
MSQNWILIFIFVQITNKDMKRTRNLIVKGRCIYGAFHLIPLKIIKH